MSSTTTVGILFALASAIVYGGADFLGALASRKRDEVHVIIIVTTFGLVSMGLFSLLWGEGLPTWRNAMWSSLSGLFGTVGLLLFYIAMKEGSPAIISPVAGVVGAGLPVIAGIFFEGMPDTWVMAGFACAIAGIWLVTQGNGDGTRQSTRVIVFAILGGLGFGLFFITLGQVRTTAVFMPLLFAKIAGLIAVLIVLKIRGLSLPKLRGPGTLAALSGGFFDAFANAFFVLAAQYTRMDTAVVLTSLYPAFTVLLASLVFKDRIGKRQWAGIIACIVAIGLIAKG